MASSSFFLDFGPCEVRNAHQDTEQHKIMLENVGVRVPSSNPAHASDVYPVDKEDGTQDME